MRAFFAIVVAGLTFFALSHKASAAEPHARRKVKGKSGHIWFTEGHDGSDGHVATSVFDSAEGNELVLIFEQVPGDTSSRRVTFQAPTALAPVAISDFS